MSTVAATGFFTPKNRGVQMRLRASWTEYTVAACRVVAITSGVLKGLVPLVYAR